MSPNSWLELKNGVLTATDGMRVSKVWTYGDFEYHTQEAITPSMYDYMINYVYENITKESLYDLEGDSYDGDIDGDAVDAYFSEPCLERQKMHTQMVTHLEKKITETRAKIAAAAPLPEIPFDPTSPLYAEVQTFWTNLRSSLDRNLETLMRELYEEEQWRGGWEEGEERTGRLMYDHMDEP
jgi:hypothetical protein